MLKLLDARLFAEDVTMEAVADRSVLWLLGPAAVRLLAAVAGDGAAERVGAAAGTHHAVEAEGARLTAYRWDLGGVLGVRLIVPDEGLVAVHRALLEAAGYEPGGTTDAEAAERRRASLRGRPVGWSAFNTVRVEGGVPLYHVDFGPDSLPAETGLLDEAVSFTKGCYLGQEVVARMKSLGHPKKLLVGLRVEGDAVPMAGSQVVEPGDKQKVIGGVTSSTAARAARAEAGGAGDGPLGPAPAGDDRRGPRRRAAGRGDGPAAGPMTGA